MADVLNIDTLRAESRPVQFLGKTFELGYIPCGAGIPIMEAYKKTMEHKDEDGSQEFFLKVVDCISLFCSFTQPDFTPDYIKENASNQQVSLFFKMIAEAIIVNFSHVLPPEKGAGEEQKKKTGEKQ